MDDQYLDAFVRESEEAITKLTNSLMELESDPSDAGAMESIFRTVHTLKGNFGAMGFDDASTLAHAMEDVLDEMRDGEIEVTGDVMDLIFAGVDRLEAIVTEIRREGESDIATESVVEDLRTVLEEGASAAGDEAASDGPAHGNATGERGGSGNAIDPAHRPSTDHVVDEIQSIRVDVDQLDDLHGLVEQLVTSRIELRRAVETDGLTALGDTLNELDRTTTSLQNTVLDMRLVPLKKVVGKFPRLVRDLSRNLGKEIEFTIEEDDIELDRTILTEISDPLMHILRNSVDHGIESPDEREAASKPRTGQVELRASRERDHVVIEVEDDGAGVDVDAITEKAVERGLRSADDLETIDDSDVYDLVFSPGFSTAEEVTDTSGRGVGMDVVHDTVSQLDGSVDVESTPGEGTTVSLRLPVTMAIVKVLFVGVGDEEYGIPLKNVDEITRPNGIKQVNGREVIRHNDEIYPVIRLGETFDVPGGAKNGDGMLVRVRESERRVALHCDSVNRQEAVVVKPREGIVRETAGLSGTAVLDDGNIVHILDVVTL